MKRLLVVFLVVAIAGIAFAESTPGDNTVSINLSGTVEPKISLQIDVTDYTTLDLESDVTDLPVAEITEKSNVASGYEVTVSSDNDFELVRSDGTDPADVTALPYSIKYDGGSVIDADGVVSSSTSRTSQSGVAKPLTVSYSAANAFLYSGTYQDTLTFEITAQ
jgi:hypothetical protein